MWHLPGGLPVQLDCATKADLLFHLSKESLKRHLLEDSWRAKSATSARSLATVLGSEVVLEAIRKELRRRTSYNCETAQIKRVLVDEVLRPELASST